MDDMESEMFRATRRSLIDRLANWNDSDGWREFFETYWKLIFSVAVKFGLTREEAQDVVQDTILTVARTMGTFKYEPERCRFKTWLMRITRMRIIDHLRKRRPEFVAGLPLDGSEGGPYVDEGCLLASRPCVESVWDEEWRRNLMNVALDRVKARVKPVHYQAFYLCVIEELGAAQVADTLGMSRPQVYLAKHRVAALVKGEARELERRMNAT